MCGTTRSGCSALVLQPSQRSQPCALRGTRSEACARQSWIEDQLQSLRFCETACEPMAAAAIGLIMMMALKRSLLLAVVHEADWQAMRVLATGRQVPRMQRQLMSVVGILGMRQTTITESETATMVTMALPRTMAGPHLHMRLQAHLITMRLHMQLQLLAQVAADACRYQEATATAGLLDTLQGVQHLMVVLQLTVMLAHMMATVGHRAHTMRRVAMLRRPAMITVTIAMQLHQLVIPD